MISRVIEKQILQKLQPQRAVLIFGARRVGKTVLLKEILSKFDGKTMLLNDEDYESVLLLEVKSIARYRELFYMPQWRTFEFYWKKRKNIWNRVYKTTTNH